MNRPISAAFRRAALLSPHQRAAPHCDVSRTVVTTGESARSLPLNISARTLDLHKCFVADGACRRQSWHDRVRFFSSFVTEIGYGVIKVQTTDSLNTDCLSQPYSATMDVLYFGYWQATCPGWSHTSRFCDQFNHMVDSFIHLQQIGKKSVCYSLFTTIPCFACD